MNDREVIDQSLETLEDRLPDGPIKTMLKEAGVVGLILGVLIGNIPVTVAIQNLMSGKYRLDSSALETYFTVLLIVAPFVTLAGAATYMICAKKMPQWGGPTWALVIGLSVLGSVWLSLFLGGVAPLEAAQGPTTGGPSGMASYTVTTLGAYLEVWGPWPCLAGVVEGCAFGRWAYALNKQ